MLKILCSSLRTHFLARENWAVSMSSPVAPDMGQMSLKAWSVESRIWEEEEEAPVKALSPLPEVRRTALGDACCRSVALTP